MSVSILDRVWKAATPGLTSFHRLLLVRLAWYADDAGTNCFAAVSSLARETGATDRGVRKAMRELRSKELVSVDTNAGHNFTNRVALNMAAIEGLPLNGGSALNGGSVLHGGSGVPLNGGSGTPEREGTSPLNGGSANKHERQDRQKKDSKAAQAPARTQAADGPATEQELAGTGLTPADFSAYMIARRKKRWQFVVPESRARWIAKFRGHYSEGKDTAHMVHQMTDGPWQGPVAEKWKLRPQELVASDDPAAIWPEFYGNGSVQ